MKMMLTSAKLTRKKKKVSFHALIKLNTKQRRQMSNLYYVLSSIQFKYKF